MQTLLLLATALAYGPPNYCDPGSVSAISSGSICQQAPTSDTAPSDLVVHSANSYPQGVQSASDLVLAGGLDEKFVTVDDYTVAAGDTVTVVLNGATTVLTEGVEFTAATSNNVTATNLATALSALSGISAAAAAAVVYITPDQCGTWDVSTAIADGAANGVFATATNGTDGRIISGADIDLGSNGHRLLLDVGLVGTPSLTFTNDLNSGIYRVASDYWGFASGGVAKLYVTPTSIQIRTVLSLAGTDPMNTGSNYIYSSTAALDLGGACSPGLGITDTSGNLCVQGRSYFNDDLRVHGSITTRDSQGLYLGTNADYWLKYDSAGTQFVLWSSNIDGAGTNGNLLTIQDGSTDFVFEGDLDLNGTQKLILDADGDSYIYSASDDLIRFWTGAGQRFTLSSVAMTMAVDINTGSRYIYSSSHALYLGGSGSPGHGDAAGQTYVKGTLEVDGVSYFDGSLETNGATLKGNIYLTASSYAMVRVGTDDGTHLALGTTGYGNNHFIFTAYANGAKDHDHDTMSTNPTVFFQSATNPDTDNTQWLSLTHNQTDAEFDTGTGGYKFKTGLKGAAAAIQYGVETITMDGSATNSSAADLIPDGAILLGVTGRVTTALVGCTSIDVGDGALANLYADNVAVAQNTTWDNKSAQNNWSVPTLADTAVVLTGNGGSCSSGAVAVTVMYIDVSAATSN